MFDKELKMLTDCCHNFDKEKCRCPTCNSLLQRVKRNGKKTLLKCTNEQCDFEFTCGDVTTSKELHPPQTPIPTFTVNQDFLINLIENDGDLTPKKKKKKKKK